jgi:hypothetical protein
MLSGWFKRYNRINIMTKLLMSRVIQFGADLCLPQDKKSQKKISKGMEKENVVGLKLKSNYRYLGLVR